MTREDLLPHELMQIVANFFEDQGVAYWVVGSMASMAYGEPRFTNDVDIVAELYPQHISQLLIAFPASDFYLSESAIRSAVAVRGQFNIIHPASGLKVDVIVAPDTAFAKSEAGRRRRVSSPGEYSVWFGSPEDVLLNKLVYFKLSEGVSQKHLRDIAGMMKLLGEKLDRQYIQLWAARLEVQAEWRLLCDRIDRS